MTKRRQRNQRTDRNRGLSLIEMIVVMAIISLFAGLVGPRIGSGLAGLELRRAERTVLDSLRDAKTYARQSGSTVFVVFDGEDQKVVLLGSDMQVVRESPLPDSVELNWRRPMSRSVVPS